MSKKILLFLFFINLLPAQSQIIFPSSSPILSDVRTDSSSFPRFRIVNLGYGRQILKDPLLSPLRYNGKMFDVAINTIKYRPKFLTNSTIFIHGNLLKSKSSGAKIYEFGGNYSFTMFKKIKGISNERWQFYIGPSAEAMFNFRLALSNVNNRYAYDATVSVGVSGLLQRNIKLFRRNFSISNQFTMPIYSVISRPQYSWSYPIFAEEGGKLKEDVQTGTVNKFFKIQNKLMIDFQLGMKHKHKSIGKSAWRFTYQYEYYNFNQLNRVQSGSEVFMIGRIHKF